MATVRVPRMPDLTDQSNWTGSIDLAATPGSYVPERQEFVTIQGMRMQVDRVETVGNTVTVYFHPVEEAEARKRAQEFLLEHLNEAQKKDFREHGGFEVISQTGRRFRIDYGSAANIYQLDKKGNRIGRYCIVPKDHYISVYDQLLMQMLMLQHNEDEFMRIAIGEVIRLNRSLLERVGIRAT